MLQPGDYGKWNVTSDPLGLWKDGVCYAIDTAETRSGYEWLRNKTGTILITGLGLGIFSDFISNQATVYVIEEDLELCDLHNNQEYVVIHSDANVFGEHMEFDYIFLDHWSLVYSTTHQQVADQLIRYQTNYPNAIVTTWFEQAEWQ